MSSWYSEHPVVSIVLWAIGSSIPIEEDEEEGNKKPSRCLSWKDEHDGSPIAEYMTTPKTSRINEVRFNKGEETITTLEKEKLNSNSNNNNNNSLGRQKSLQALPRTDSDVS